MPDAIAERRRGAIWSIIRFNFTQDAPIGRLRPGPGRYKLAQLRGTAAEMSDTPQTSRRRGRPVVIAADARRRTILAAAEQVFAAEGYANASMAAIAQTAGMSKKTIYALFPNKRALFEALAHDVEAFAAAMDIGEGLAPLEALRRSLGNLVGFILSPRQVLVTRLLIAAGQSEQGMAAGFRDSVIVRSQAHHVQLLSALAPDNCPVEKIEQMARQLVGFALGDFHILALVGVLDADAGARAQQQADDAVALVPLMLERFGQAGP